MSGDTVAEFPHFALTGRTYVYALPCRDEDVLKFGFSRDPLQRLQTLHRRYFEFFDLERALLIEVETLGDARRLERVLIERHASERVPAPLVIRAAAAGKTEWFRGVAASADALMRDTAHDEGWTLHSPLAAWLRQRFAARSDLIYDWSEAMLEVIEYEHYRADLTPRDLRAERILRRFLDACSAVAADISAWVPPTVLAWYLDGGYR